MKKSYNFEDIEDVYRSGIYKITCIENSKTYIGSTIRRPTKNPKRTGFFRRWTEHIVKLRNKNHRNQPLQNAYNKYGENSFTFEILEICEDSSLIVQKEEYYMEKFKSYEKDLGFNLLRGHLANYNKRTKEHTEKIASALRGKKRPLEVVKQWSNKVQQFDSEMNLIAEYYSMSEASRQTGIMRQDIGQACIGIKMKRAGGFFWKKVKDIV